MAATPATRNWSRSAIAAGLSAALAMQATSGLLGQARAARRGGAVQIDEGGAAVGKRGAAVKTDEGAAVATRHGAAVKTEEGVLDGQPGLPRAGGSQGGRRWAMRQPWLWPRGAVVVGEEDAAAGALLLPGWHGVEDNDAWRTAAGVAAGVAAGIAIGTLLAKPRRRRRQ